MKWERLPSFFSLSALFVTLIGLGFHLQAAWHQQLFGDEVHSLFFSQLSWLTLLRSPVEPVHPNGYYLFLKTVYGLTPWVTALRLWQAGVVIIV